MVLALVFAQWLNLSAAPGRAPRYKRSLRSQIAPLSYGNLASLLQGPAATVTWYFKLKQASRPDTDLCREAAYRIGLQSLLLYL